MREGEKLEAEVDLIKSELKSETSECGFHIVEPQQDEMEGDGGVNMAV